MDKGEDMARNLEHLVHMEYLNIIQVRLAGPRILDPLIIRPLDPCTVLKGSDRQCMVVELRM